MAVWVLQMKSIIFRVLALFILLDEDLQFPRIPYVAILDALLPKVHQ